jgi:(+)-trans-carveol dehydrogenase
MVSPRSTTNDLRRMEGKVAVISGAARGQGRAHAVTLAREGASIVAFDICEPLEYPLTPGATEEDLAETVRLVEALDQRCIGAKVDVRDLAALEALADRTIAEFGQVDTLVVNHGIWTVSKNAWELQEEAWQESVDILLTGVWRVTKAFIPTMIDAGRGGSIVVTVSGSGPKPQPGAAAYCSAKSGVAGLVKVLAWELGDHGIRVNGVNPGSIATPMLLEGGTLEKGNENWPRFFGTNRALLSPDTIPQPPESISSAVLFLTSDEASEITGAFLPVDQGFLNF